MTIPSGWRTCRCASVPSAGSWVYQLMSGSPPGLAPPLHNQNFWGTTPRRRSSPVMSYPRTEYSSCPLLSHLLVLLQFRLKPPENSLNNPSRNAVVQEFHNELAWQAKRSRVAGVRYLGLKIRGQMVEYPCEACYTSGKNLQQS